MDHKKGHAFWLQQEQADGCRAEVMKSVWMLTHFFVRLQKTALPKLRMPVVRPKLSMMAMGPRSTAATAFRA